jgi:hypothetical protein
MAPEHVRLSESTQDLLAHLEAQQRETLELLERMGENVVERTTRYLAKRLRRKDKHK